MGTLRLLLATAVVLSHVGGLAGFHLTGGRTAVQAFFMISGFYMALVLGGRYAGVPYRVFLGNRLLRIFPLYWVAAILTLAWSAVCGLVFGQWARLQPLFDCVEHMRPATLAWLAWTNIFLVGHETSVFAGLDQTSGSLYFAPDYRTTTPFVHQFMLVPQAWSLSLEVVFYVVAPLLLRMRTAFVAGGALLSLVLRVALSSWFGWDHDPWDYRFFPTELLFFLSGALSFRLSSGLRPSLRSHRRTCAAVLLLVWGVTVAYHLVPLDYGVKPWLYYGMLFLAMPFVFAVSSADRTDRFLGELSYPVYVVHVLAFAVMSTRLLGGPHALALKTLGGTLVAAVAMVLFISYPLERLRERRVVGARAAGTRPAKRPSSGQ